MSAFAHRTSARSCNTCSFFEQKMAVKAFGLLHLNVQATSSGTSHYMGHVANNVLFRSTDEF